nr:immunoglobulin light chain junction region [Mus musculus]NSL97060.1 immunoglobulin light chain junction region [Mus musculus]NSL97292.1 immunoglobulin light chain junction region [Mus musculus]NSL97939.1 immunoglobulin light chain junction region [Mus musculus]NSL98019.1 immunoglobulin light chain junction region [Mus musculus]
CSQSTHVPYTF